MILGIDEIKHQLRLDDDLTDEEHFLELLGRAVQSTTETYLNRNLYPPDETIPDNDPDGLNLPDDVRLGMLLLLTHFYENRSSVSEVEKTEAPFTYHWLVGPYRFIPS